MSWPIGFCDCRSNRRRLVPDIVNRPVRPLLNLLALVWLALGMSIPASAWSMHEASHGATQVSVDAHHHHESDGGISVHDHDDGDAPDCGHDHMPSILLGAVALADSAVALAMPAIEREAFSPALMHGVESHTASGLRRPPRLG